MARFKSTGKAAPNIPVTIVAEAKTEWGERTVVFEDAAGRRTKPMADIRQADSTILARYFEQNIIR